MQHFKRAGEKTDTSIGKKWGHYGQREVRYSVQDPLYWYNRRNENIVSDDR